MAGDYTKAFRPAGPARGGLFDRCATRSVSRAETMGVWGNGGDDGAVMTMAW